MCAPLFRPVRCTTSCVLDFRLCAVTSAQNSAVRSVCSERCSHASGWLPFGRRGTAVQRLSTWAAQRRCGPLACWVAAQQHIRPALAGPVPLQLTPKKLTPKEQAEAR